MKLCFLIPAYNEAKVIRKSILGCYRAGVPHEDVYVVDDGSKDETSAIARHYRAQVLTKPNGGKAAALEAGLQYFDLVNRYTHIAVLDADSVIDPGYVLAMEQAVLKHEDAVLFCGRQCSARGPKWNWLTAHRTGAYAVWCGVYREAQHATGTVNVAPGFASMYELRTFASLDFHGGTVVEDMDMTIELQRRGAQIVYVPDATVYTQDPTNLRDFCGQMMRWYRGTWQVIKKHKLGRRRQRVDVEVGMLIAEQMVTGALIVTLPIWLYYYPTVVLYSVVIDQLMVLTYTVLTAIRERRPELIVMFPTFVVPRLIGFFLFVWAYLLELRTTETKWYSAARY